VTEFVLLADLAVLERIDPTTQVVLDAGGVEIRGFDFSSAQEEDAEASRFFPATKVYEPRLTRLGAWCRQARIERKDAVEPLLAALAASVGDLLPRHSGGD
jgi:hypothetical protein